MVTAVCRMGDDVRGNSDAPWEGEEVNRAMKNPFVIALVYDSDALRCEGHQMKDIKL
jgi:hypothetical protein